MPLAAGDDRPPGPPLLRVVRGDATAEEIAALVAVLVTRVALARKLPAGPVRSEIPGPTGHASSAARYSPARAPGVTRPCPGSPRGQKSMIPPSPS